MEPVVGKVTQLTKKSVTFSVDLDEMNISRLSDFADGKLPTAAIQFDDNRSISSLQRKKTYAILGDISKWNGDFNVEMTKDDMKIQFLMRSGYDDWFSLSNCSMSLARDFISFLIEFCIEWGIELHAHPHHLTEDIDRYIYACLINRVCCITGELNADVHHCGVAKKEEQETQRVMGSIGLGMDRTKVNHAEYYLIPLNRYWHNRAHSEGEKEIFETFKVFGIKLKAEDLKKIGLKGEDIT